MAPARCNIATELKLNIKTMLIRRSPGNFSHRILAPSPSLLPITAHCATVGQTKSLRQTYAQNIQMHLNKCENFITGRKNSQKDMRQTRAANEKKKQISITMMANMMK